ncbi:MAG: HAD family hydrolase, partial [Victivallales bacterium]|nr:HAD family hydrolase [Victivallales bacterium]
RLNAASEGEERKRGVVTKTSPGDEAIAARREGGWDESFAIASKVSRILMDIDGTVTEVLPGSERPRDPLRLLVELVMDKDGCDAESAERKIRSCGDLATHCLSEFLPALGIEPASLFSAVKAELGRRIRIPGDVCHFLQSMKRRGIPVCAATTNSRFMTLAKLAVGGLAELDGSPYVSAFHPGCEFRDPEGKFSPRYFPNILEHHHYDPETLLMLGDEPEHDLFPALRAGIRHVCIIDREQTEESLFRDGGLFVRSLKTLEELI